MSTWLLGVSVVLASYFAASSAVALVVRAACPANGRFGARRLLRARLAPAALAFTLAFAVVGPAFLVFEPRDAGERVSPSLALLALGGLALVGASAGRILREVWRTRRLVRGWDRTSRRVSLPGCPVPAFSVGTVFPVVAVAGVLRPRLFVSAALLRRLTPAELSAVVGHEIGHLRAGDNLKRLLLRGSVDLFAWSRWCRSLDERWHEAAEDAADDHAVRELGTARLDLADALLKVARLSGSLDLACPTSALFRGERVARRVRRLLAVPHGAGGAPAPGWGMRLAAATCLPVGVALATTSPGVHSVVEALVRVLP